MVKITKLILFYGFYLYLHPVSGLDPDPKPQVMDRQKVSDICGSGSTTLL
jgi:hypothetical protein